MWWKVWGIGSMIFQGWTRVFLWSTRSYFSWVTISSTNWATKIQSCTKLSISSFAGQLCSSIYWNVTTTFLLSESFRRWKNQNIRLTSTTWYWQYVLPCMLQFHSWQNSALTHKQSKSIRDTVCYVPRSLCSSFSQTFLGTTVTRLCNNFVTLLNRSILWSVILFFTTLSSLSSQCSSLCKISKLSIFFGMPLLGLLTLLLYQLSWEFWFMQFSTSLKSLNERSFS